MEGLAVGRIVHVTDLRHDYSTGQLVTTSVCRAAIVTEVSDQAEGRATATVFLPGGSVDGIVVMPGTFDGGWHWPERA